MTGKERAKSRQLQKKANEAKSHRNDVKMDYNKIIVNADGWRWNKFTGKLEHTDSKN